jgi:glycosyltransferase involved in cell wall biosynthesis
MNILILGCKEYPYGSNNLNDSKKGGGGAKYISNLINNLNEKKYKNFLVTIRYRNQKKKERINNIYVSRVNSLHGKYTRLPSFSINSYFNSNKIIRKNKIDVILSTGVFPTITGLLLSKRWKIPCIARTAGQAYTQYNGLSSKILKSLEKLIYSKVSHLVFATEAEKNHFRNKVGVKNKFSIIPTGVYVNLNQDSFKPKKKIRLLFVGRLAPVKGLKYLIKSIRDLGESSKKVELTIVGDGIEKDNILKLTKSYKLNNIKFVGFQKDVEKFYRENDIFILPSLSEGMPNSLLEAMSYRLTCIITDIGLPFPENSVYKVQPRSSEGIKKAILYFLKNKKKIKEYGYNANKYVIRNHSWKNSSKQYEKLLKELIQK